LICRRLYDARRQRRRMLFTLLFFTRRLLMARYDVDAAPLPPPMLLMSDIFR